MTASGLLDALVGTGSQAADATPQAVKAVAWARVSTDMQDARGLSMPEQVREIREYAAKHDIEITSEFSEAVSAYGKEEHRVEFRRMLAHVKAHKDVSVILVHDFSRFSRDSLRAQSLIRDLREAGVKVISLNDPEVDPDTVAGTYMSAITFAGVEAYSKAVAFHTRKGCRANVATRDPETGWCYKNGGQPLWGYRSERLQRGEERKGKPIVKAIWLLDDTMVAGKPAHEWVRHCLVELAAKGASLHELRDFCNDHGIPARRQRYWGHSTWRALLEPQALLKYCGHEAWNVHRPDGSIRPASEWVVVENAHPPLISEKEARLIAAVRRSASSRRFDTGYSTSRTSPYLLSGGLFKCGRCGANMVGLNRSDGTYYVCGSSPNRRNLGCGPGVYVPVEFMEAEVLAGLRDWLGACTDSRGMVREINEELRALWEQGNGHDPRAGARLQEIEAKVANIRRAVEDGLGDAAWATGRLQELVAERERLAPSLTSLTSLNSQPTLADSPGLTSRSSLNSPPIQNHEAPRIDAAAARAYRRETERILTHGDPAEKKSILRAWVNEVRLAPESLSVETTYRIPDPIAHCVVAGAR
jgi:hypothetical protein